MRLNAALAKLAIAASMSLGLLLLALGILGDREAWWNNWPFLTNLLASLATALIGFPVALLVVSQIAARYRLDMDQRIARSRALQLIHELNSDIATLCPGPDSIAALLDLFRSSYRIPAPAWVIHDAISHWKIAFPVARLEAGQSQYMGVIAATAPDFKYAESLFSQLLELRSSYQSSGLEWPDEGRLADCRAKLAYINSVKFRSEFRVAAQELMRLQVDGGSSRALSVDDMTEAIAPVNAVFMILRYLTHFFEAGDR